MYWLDPRRRRSVPTHKGNHVPACRECNGLLGNYCLNTLRDRAEHLSAALEHKYRRLLCQPLWTDEEIDAMGRTMQQFIRARAAKRQIILDRLAHLGTISRFGAESVREYWDRVS